VLQIRDLSYPDTQLIRLGGQNFGHCRCQSTEL
jgi:catalase